MTITQSLSAAIEDWVPTIESGTTALTPEPAAVLAEILQNPGPHLAEGDELPSLWHWPYFSRLSSLTGLGEDGHPIEGAHYPPIPDRRRMFVGGRLTIHRPLRIGWTATVHGEVVDKVVKRGRSGEMLFVTVRRTFTQGGDRCVVEEQDIMYRSGDAAKRRQSEPVEMTPSSVPLHYAPHYDNARLFAFSAITANAHRIHYDVEYARAGEGYPGLVVHGPLLVLSMLELARAGTPGSQIATVTYRLQNPVILGDDARVEALSSDDQVDLVMRSSRHDVVASATVTLR
jgi:3-methylfumaryl-CoA hydratase